MYCIKFEYQNLTNNYYLEVQIIADFGYKDILHFVSTTILLLYHYYYCYCYSTITIVIISTCKLETPVDLVTSESQLLP